MRTRTIILTCVLVAILSISTLSIPVAKAEIRTKSLNPPPGTRVVEIELEASPERNTTLANYNITPLVEYSLYVLAYANDEQIAAMEGNGILVGKMTNRTIVRTQGYQFDTMNGEPDLPLDLRIDHYELNTEGLYIVQLIGPTRDEWLTALKEKGVEFYESIPTYNYLIRMNSNIENEVRDLWFVQWVGIYQPAYKFVQNVTGTIFYITLWNGSVDYGSLSALAMLGTIIDDDYGYLPDRYVVLLQTNSSNINDIACLPDVIWIDRWENAGPLNTDNTQIRLNYSVFVITLALIIITSVYVLKRYSEKMHSKSKKIENTNGLEGEKK